MYLSLCAFDITIGGLRRATHTDRALFIILFCFIQFSFSFLLSSLRIFVLRLFTSFLSHKHFIKSAGQLDRLAVNEAHITPVNKRAKLKNTKEVHIIMFIGTTISPLALLTFLSSACLGIKKWWDEISFGQGVEATQFLIYDALRIFRLPEWNSRGVSGEDKKFKNHKNHANISRIKIIIFSRVLRWTPQRERVEKRKKEKSSRKRRQPLKFMLIVSL